MLRIIREEEPPRPSLRLSRVGSAHQQNGAAAEGQPLPSTSLASVAALRQTEPAKLVRLVRGELDWIVMKAMEKDRSRRYETANGFAADIERYLSDEPVLACPPSAAYRLKKFARRNKGPVAALSLVVMALVAGIIGTTWGMVRADKARRDADAAQLAEGERAEGERRAKDEAQRALEAERKAKETETAQRRRAEAADWAARRERAKAHAYVGQLRLKTNNYAGSEEAYGQAVHLMEELAHERPNDFDNAYDLAYTYYSLCVPYGNAGRLGPAKEFVRRAATLFEKLPADFPDQRSQIREGRWAARRELAKAYATGGQLQLKLKDYAGSEEAYVQAVDLMEELASEQPKDFDSAYDLAYTYYWFCVLYRDTGRLGPAEEKIRRAIARFEKLAADFPDQRPQIREDRADQSLPIFLPDQRSQVQQGRVTILSFGSFHFPDRPSQIREGRANCQRILAFVLHRAGRHHEAEKAFRQFTSIWSELAAAYPDEWHLPRFVAWAHYDVAGILQASGQVDGAVDAYGQAFALFEQAGRFAPENRQFARDTLQQISQILAVAADNLLQQGKHAEAAKVAERMLNALRKDPNARQSAAVLLARCVPLAERDAQLSEADRKAIVQAYVDRSRELIREAAEKGGEKGAAPGEKPKQ